MSVKTITATIVWPDDYPTYTPYAEMDGEEVDVVLEASQTIPALVEQATELVAVDYRKGFEIVGLVVDDYVIYNPHNLGTTRTW